MTKRKKQKNIWEPIPRATPKDDVVKARGRGAAKKAKKAKKLGKPGPKPMKRFEVKVDDALFAFVKAAIKKSRDTPANWLKAALQAAANLELGEPTGKHPVLAAEPEEVPDATEHAVETTLAVHGAPTGGVSFEQPSPTRAPTLSVPAPAPQWQMGRVPPPVWQQPPAIPVGTTPPDDEAPSPYPNGRPPVQ